MRIARPKYGSQARQDLPFNELAGRSFRRYDRAFATIVDANMTTLLVAIVLFSLGSGAVKGFAVTLTIGLITSMFTAITGTRAVDLSPAIYTHSQLLKAGARSNLLVGEGMVCDDH